MSNVERIPVQRYEQEELMLNKEAFAKECLIHISVNNQRVTTLLASPDDLLDLAIGHLAVEHAFRPSNSHVNHRIVEGKNEYSVEIMVKTSQQFASRQTIVTSSCGACDQENLDHLVKRTPSVDQQTLPFSIQTIIETLHDLRQQQPGFQETGGMHAAGLYLGPDERPIVCEDIGRHNAVDKAIGRSILRADKNIPMALLLSGRCGWDIVSKAAHMNIPVVASIGAASSLAVETARASNMTLISFAKPDKAVVIGPVEGRFQRNH